MLKRKQKRTKASKRGSLTVIATLFMLSAFIRILIEAPEAFAKESSAEDIMDMEPPTEAVAQSCVTDDGLDALLDMMDAREEKIRNKEKEIDQRTAMLRDVEQEVTKKLDEMKKAEATLRKTLTIADEAAEDDVNRLTKIYESMKPKDAAKMFETMSPEFAAGFLARMKPDAAAGILTGLSPENAYTISVLLAGRNANAMK